MKMSMHTPVKPTKWVVTRKILRRSVTYVLLLLVADIIGMGLPSTFLGRHLLHYFTLLLLVEAGFLFLIGGVLDFTGSLAYRRLADHASGAEKSWSFGRYKEKQVDTAVYVLAGIVLLALSFVLAYPLN
jgi:hypothetical protein